ncbi:MAG: DUF3127 domain-containing protein [Bacteroidales bacterium]|nr:DUF3127 domain-containing protein [Bacteroidales bacterium]
MNISGKITQILPEVKGEGRNGPWKRQDFIIETDDQYPKKVCISVWNDKVDVGKLQPGDPVTLEISVESREYNGRWYTDVKASGLLAAPNPGTGRAEFSGRFQDEIEKVPPPDKIPDDLPEEEENDLPF